MGAVANVLIVVGIASLLIISYTQYDDAQTQRELSSSLATNITLLQTQILELTANNSALQIQKENLSKTVQALENQLKTISFTIPQSDYNNPANRNECMESDGGNVTTTAGWVSYRVRDETGAFIASGKESDTCIGTKAIREYYCNPDGSVGVYTVNCPTKCTVGFCI